VIAFESGVTDTVDPLAGSYFVENLTDEIEAAAQVYLDKIDAIGGAVEAIEQGYVQNEISIAAYHHQLEVEAGNRVIVGVNKFTQEQEGITEVMRIDESIRNFQAEQIRLLKTQRNADEVAEKLSELKRAAGSSNNIMPFILAAVEVYATLGEISDVLRAEFGEY